MQRTSQKLELNVLKGNKNRAINQLDSGIARSPDQGDLWLARAIAHHAQGNWKQALIDIETTMTLMPLPMAGQLVLADCYANSDKQSLAVTAYEYLLSKGSLPSEIYASIYAGFKKCGRSDLALVTCREAIRYEPENDVAYFGMAHCMVSLDYASNYVASILKQAISLQPNNATYRISLAIQLVRCGELQSAYQEVVQTPLESLKSVICICSARKLLELCVWAEDSKRCRYLCQHIDKINSADKNFKNQEGGVE